MACLAMRFAPKDEDKQGRWTRPTAIDLFSGSGGLTLGLRLAGFRVIGAVEIDPLAIETYTVNHRGVAVWGGDIREIEAGDVRRALGVQKGQLDVVAGCPPCQGFSSMRTLNGARAVDDPRNNLVFEFLRFVKEFRPKAVMMENVPALAVDERIRRLCDDLCALGYDCDRRVLDAADFAVAQRRRRMILLAGRSQRMGFPTPEANRRTVRDAIGWLPPPGQSGDPLHDLPEKRSDRITELIKAVPKNGGSRMDLGKDNQLACHRKCNGFRDVYGRMRWDDVAPTMTSGCINPSKGRFLHPEQDRAITLREAALLQSFPPDHFFSLSRGKYAAAALVGNALPPELIKAIASAVRRSME